VNFIFTPLCFSTTLWPANQWPTRHDNPLGGFILASSSTFAGLPNDKQRADVIAYLDTLSKNPVPLPKPQ
jgi:cytochrome c2